MAEQNTDYTCGNCSSKATTSAECPCLDARVGELAGKIAIYHSARDMRALAETQIIRVGLPGHLESLYI
ncbi:hypothetical protein KA107_00830 [Candidatus Pacearchaeota archaeon]|nr:hypothetical protein [Candidatus Pacearchaeota archaeon]